MRAHQPILLIIMTTSIETKESVKIAPKTDIKEPSKWHVIYINDDVTTQNFVIETLILICLQPKIAIFLFFKNVSASSFDYFLNVER